MWPPPQRAKREAVRKAEVVGQLMLKAKAQHRKFGAVSGCGRRGAEHASGGTQSVLGVARGSVGFLGLSTGLKLRTSTPQVKTFL